MTSASGPRSSGCAVGRTFLYRRNGKRRRQSPTATDLDYSRALPASRPVIASFLPFTKLIPSLPPFPFVTLRTSGKVFLIAPPSSADIAIMIADHALSLLRED